MAAPITSFRGEYRFLSNFWPAEVTYEGISFPTVEHAYQAAKTLDTDMRYAVKIKTVTEEDGVIYKTAAEAKRFGAMLELRPDWDKVRVPIMAGLLAQKFQDEELWEKLCATAPAELIEGNTWGDTFWGQCPLGTGKNTLGKLLMAIRDDITVKYGT